MMGALERELSFAQEVVQEAASILREIYARGVRHVEYKSSAVDLVTEGDMASEKVILERLKAQFPDDAVLGEETGAHGSGRRRWIFDPLDGTTNFAHRLPIFGSPEKR